MSRTLRILALLGLLSCVLGGGSWTILHKLERSTLVYTQGLIYWKGQLMESGGQYGDSSIGTLNVEADKSRVTSVIFRKNDSNVFAEGLDIPNGDFAYQLTWTSNKIFAWKTDLSSPVPNFAAPFPQGVREGWGLTHDPENPS